MPIIIGSLGEEDLAVDVVAAGRAHLLRQCAGPAEEPPGVVRHGLGTAAGHAPGEPKLLPHLDPPVAAVEQPARAEQHAGAAHRVADVQRRHAQHPERREAEQRERGGVHARVPQAQPLHVPPEHAEGAGEGVPPGRRRVAGALEHAAGPLRLDDDVPDRRKALFCIGDHGVRARELARRAGLSQRAADGVHGGGDRRDDAEHEEAVLGELGARAPGVPPVEPAEHVLARDGKVDQCDDDGQVGGVAGSPAAEEEEVVAERGVLVEAHEREERVEHLVVGLDPAAPVRRRRERGVEQAEEEEHEHAAGDANAEEPEEQRDVHGVLEPFLARTAEGAPVDGGRRVVVGRFWATEGGELPEPVRALLWPVAGEEVLGGRRRGGSVAGEGRGVVVRCGRGIVIAGEKHGGDVARSDG